MRQYLDLLERILSEGSLQENRTGINAIRLDGHMLQFNMADGFPAVTTKKLAFNSVKGELIGFIRGYQSADDFRALGCKVWDQNANENVQWLANPYRKGEDHLGRIYGVQWRSWATDSELGLPYIDQLANAVNDVMHNPTSRRIIVNAWNPAELQYMALPPCHMMFQLLVDVKTNTLSMLMYQRSCDAFLGIPFNIASYALLLHLIARATGKNPGKLTMFLADVHIYENHVDQVQEQLLRKPFCPPILALEQVSDEAGIPYIGMQYLDNVKPEDIRLVCYDHHPAIKAPMAV